MLHEFGSLSDAEVDANALDCRFPAHFGAEITAVLVAAIPGGGPLSGSRQELQVKDL